MISSSFFCACVSVSAALSVPAVSAVLSLSALVAACSRLSRSFFFSSISFPRNAHRPRMMNRRTTMIILPINICRLFLFLRASARFCFSLSFIFPSTLVINSPFGLLSHVFTGSIDIKLYASIHFMSIDPSNHNNITSIIEITTLN